MSNNKTKEKQMTMLDRIRAKIESKNNKGGDNKSYPVDARFWKPTFDKDKGGSAVIRFLPSKNTNELPFVELITHFFRGPSGKIYSEKSLKTIGKDDPVSSINSRLWNTGIKSDKEQASAQKRKMKYISNILVIKDPAHPENNGKVFLYEYGPAIWNKMEAVMMPTVEDEEPIDIFDLDEGSTFYIRIKPQAMPSGDIVPSYTDSTFAPETSAVSGDHDEFLSNTYELGEFVSEDAFKSYDTLAKKLIEVLGYETGSGIETVEGYSPTPVTSVGTPAAKASKTSKADEDDDFDAIRKMLNGDTDETSFDDGDDGEDDEIAKMKAILAADD